MAYTKRIVSSCYFDGCEKEARWEVFNRLNASLGKFCKVHANDRVMDQRIKERVSALTKRGGSDG